MSDDGVKYYSGINLPISPIDHPQRHYFTCYTVQQSPGDQQN
jgi:hypothetical protein